MTTYTDLERKQYNKSINFILATVIEQKFYDLALF